MKRALLGLALGGVLSRVGLAGSEGILRGLDGQEPGLILVGLVGLLAFALRRKKRALGWRRELGAGLLLGLGLGSLGALPITLAASLGEGRLLAIPLLVVCYAGWRFAGRWDPLGDPIGDSVGDPIETAPAAPPAPGRSEAAPPDSATDSAG